MGRIYAGFIIAILLQRKCRAGILPLTREEALQRLQVERKDEKEYARRIIKFGQHKRYAGNNHKRNTGLRRMRKKLSDNTAGICAL